MLAVVHSLAHTEHANVHQRRKPDVFSHKRQLGHSILHGLHQCNADHLQENHHRDGLLQVLGFHSFLRSSIGCLRFHSSVCLWLYSEQDQKVCYAARFQVDDFRVQVAGPQVYISTVIDAYASTDTPSTVSVVTGTASRSASLFPLLSFMVDACFHCCSLQLNRTTYASRGTYAYAVTTSTTFPVPTITTLTFSVSNAYSTLHVVLDAPTDANGLTDVTAVANGANCDITLTGLCCWCWFSLLSML